MWESILQLGLTPFFTAVYGAGFRPYVKPDPRIFKEVVAASGGTMDFAVMIGDSVTDLHTALNTSARPLNELGVPQLCPGARSLDKLNASLR